MCDGCGGLVRVVEAFYTMLLHVSQKRQNPLHLGLDHVSDRFQRLCVWGRVWHVAGGWGRSAMRVQLYLRLGA